jgi:hypothetical protein
LIEYTVARIKSSHGSHGVPGAAAMKQMNGNELSRWIMKWTPPELIKELVRWGETDVKKVTHLNRIYAWLSMLHSHLLHNRKWTETDLFKFSSFVDDIQGMWKKVTGTKPFPKLHMLRHCLEFAERHHYLGKFSEAYMESYHGKYNVACDRHMNQGKNAHERMRRALADILLKAIQPSLLSNRLTKLPTTQ